MMKLSTYECRVILLMISLCCGSALHLTTETEVMDDTQTGWGSSVAGKQSCPTWYVEIKHDGVSRCVCGATLEGNVKCDDAQTQETLILAGYCMSYNETINDTVIGRCPFTYHYPDAQTFYVILPNDTHELNSFMCDGLNRTGLLCSQCQQDLGPAILSYKRECVECFDKRYGWLLYLTATLIPTTILCLLVMIFGFHVISAEMNAFVYFCQMITCASTLSNSYIYVHYAGNSAIHYFVLAIVTFFGIWNLDFFRYFIPSFCISSDMNMLHLLSLEYVVAIYPLVLTVIIYFCIEMHDRGVRVIVFLWRPFYLCFARFRRRWDPKGSVINTFATFLLLSYSKILTVSYSLLAVSDLHNNRGERVGPVLFFYDASIEYFSRQHLPFGVLAICVLLVFVLFPMLLLLLYPMRLFQRCLGYCTRIRWQFLHTFADVFQGFYKNGTNGTRDCRYFAGLYLLFRAVLLVAFISPSSYRWLILTPFPGVASLLFAYFRPYKKNFFNILDCLCFALLALTTFLIMYGMRINPFPMQLLYVLVLIPPLYFISFILYKICSQVALFRSVCSRIGERLKIKTSQHLHIRRCNSIDDELPDRIVNPHMYEPLLPATNSGEKRFQSDSQPQAGVNSLAAYGSM